MLIENSFFYMRNVRSRTLCLQQFINRGETEAVLAMECTDALLCCSGECVWGGVKHLIMPEHPTVVAASQGERKR